MTNSKRASATALIVILLNSSACATIVNRRYQQIPVKADAPVSITLRCDGLAPVSATAPTSLSVKRRATPCEVVTSTNTVPLERRVSRAFWGNLLWPPVLAALALAGSDNKDCQGAFFCLSRTQDTAIAAFLGLLIAGAGMAIDGGTGALFKHEPREIEIVLPPPQENRP